MWKVSIVSGSSIFHEWEVWCLLLITEGPVFCFWGVISWSQCDYGPAVHPPKWSSTDKCNPIQAPASENADVLRYLQRKWTKIIHHIQQDSAKHRGTVNAVLTPSSKPRHSQQPIMQIWNWNLCSAQKKSLQPPSLQNKADYILFSNSLSNLFWKPAVQEI